MNKKLVSLFISILFLGQSADTVCSVVEVFSSMRQILTPRWSSISGHKKYVNVDGKIYLIAMDSEGVPVVDDTWFAKKRRLIDEKLKEFLRISKRDAEGVGRASEELRAQKTEIEKDIRNMDADIRRLEQCSRDDIGRSFTAIEFQPLYPMIQEKGKGELSFDEVQKVQKVTKVEIKEGSPASIYYAPKHYEKTATSNQVKDEIVGELKTEGLKPAYRFMLGDKMMKLWFVSVYSGAVLCSLKVAEKLHKIFVAPRMKKLVRTLEVDPDEELDELVEDLEQTS